MLRVTPAIGQLTGLQVVGLTYNQVPDRTFLACSFDPLLILRVLLVGLAQRIVCICSSLTDCADLGFAPPITQP